MARRKAKPKPKPKPMQPAETPGLLTLLLPKEPVPGEVLTNARDIYDQPTGKTYTVISLKRGAGRVTVETEDGKRQEAEYYLPTPITDFETYDTFDDLPDS